MLISLLPIVYLFLVYNQLPQNVPLHYNLGFVADRFGDKTGLAALIIFLFAISLSVSLRMINLNKFDPKQIGSPVKPLIIKISCTSVAFMALLSGLTVYQAQNYHKPNAFGFSSKSIPALIALFIVIFGNFTNSLKPNYYVGIRTPWTLEDPENWRKTHYLASKIWVFGGIVLLFLILIFPISNAQLFFYFSLIPFVIIPFGYFYYIFR